MAAAAIPVVGSVIGGILGSIGSGRAAKAQSDAQIAAEHGVLGATGMGLNDVSGSLAINAPAVTNAANASNAYQQGNLNTQTGALAPFIGAGQAGATGLQNYAASNPTFSFAPTQAQLESTPGYQFQLQSALGATQNAAAAAGSGAGSNANLDLQKTAAGIAGEYYQNAFQNAQQTFQTNQNAKLANLSTLIGAGLTGTGQQGAALAQLGNPIAERTTNAALFNAGQGLQGNEFMAQYGLQGANLAGQYAVGAGNAHAGGILGQYNNLASGIEGALGGLTGMLPSVFGPNPMSTSGVLSGNTNLAMSGGFGG